MQHMSNNSVHPLVHQMGTLPCSMVNSLTKTTEEQCKFMIDNDCLEDEAAIDYVYLVFCEISYDMRHMAVSLIAFLVIVLFLNLSAVADEFLCPSLLTVSKNLRMSDSVAGVTLLAFGNGCPDIFSSLAAASSNRPELIVGELLGAGIFCTSIVAGLIFINNDFKIARRPLLRDTSFYLLAVYLIWLYCRQGRVTFYGSIAFIVIYVIYLFIALSGQAIHSRMRGEYPLAETHDNEKKSKLDDCVATTEAAAAATIFTSEQIISKKVDAKEVGACHQLGAPIERSDEYESWFAWRDESGRRRSSVKKEQIELARLEFKYDSVTHRQMCATNNFGGRVDETTKTTIHNNHMQQQQQHHHHHDQKNEKNEKINLRGVLDIRRDSKATTFVELATGQSVINLCDYETARGGNKRVNDEKQRNKLEPIDETLPVASKKVNLVEQQQKQQQQQQQQHNQWGATQAECDNSFTLSELDDFLFHINPINSIVWSESRWLIKIMSILRAPVLFLTILTVPVVDHEKRNNNWCRLLNSIHCFMVPGAIVMLTKMGDDKDDAPHPVTGGANHTGYSSSSLAPRSHELNVSHNNNLSLQLPDHTVDASSNLTYQLDGFEAIQVILLLAPGFLLALFVFNTTHPLRAPKYHVVFAYFGFCMSIGWIYVLATEIVSLLKTIGIVFSMTDTAIGLSVMAWGNSLGDIVANLTLAEAGYARMALGASIGAPLLNLLLGFGLSFSYSLKPGGWAAIQYGHTITLLASTLALVLILLMLSTLAPTTGGPFSKKLLGYLLIGCYGVYFSLAVCLECGVFESLTTTTTT